VRERDKIYNMKIKTRDMYEMIEITAELAKRQVGFICNKDNGFWIIELTGAH
jgi:hypothetical protein